MIIIFIAAFEGSITFAGAGARGGRGGGDRKKDGGGGRKKGVIDLT